MEQGFSRALVFDQTLLVALDQAQDAGKNQEGEDKQDDEGGL